MRGGVRFCNAFTHYSGYLTELFAHPKTRKAARVLGDMLAERYNARLAAAEKMPRPKLPDADLSYSDRNMITQAATNAARAAALDTFMSAAAAAGLRTEPLPKNVVLTFRVDVQWNYAFVGSSDFDEVYRTIRGEYDAAVKELTDKLETLDRKLTLADVVGERDTIKALVAELQALVNATANPTVEVAQ